jgi:hypothetical protein
MLSGHDEGKELQLPDHRSVERSSLFRRNGRIYRRERSLARLELNQMPNMLPAHVWCQN